MKKIWIYLICLVVGILLGAGVCHNYHVKTVPDIQKDTTYIYEKVPYSRLDLEKMSVQITVPEVDVPKMVFIREDSTTIIYRDSVRYVTLPREYYYTSTNDVEIWHSGIDSTIDSLNIVRKSANVTNVYKPKDKKNSLSLGIETCYSDRLSTPIYLEYGRMLHKNVGVFGKIEYDLPSGQYGVGIGLELQIGW